tara:strand:- start:5943 stop:6686 length:744 start_codon:yes stop_codon:yes gene_type:complete
MVYFKDKIFRNKLKGYWSIIPSLQIHEIMGIAGFNFGIIDLEHGTYSFQEALESVIAIKKSGMSALIRPSSHDEKEILRCLELGVDGICIPHIKNIKEAKSVLSFAKYPPKGIRGASGFTRATRYGADKFDEHVVKSNKSIFISLLIESMEGLSNAKEIAELDGVDNLYFGTYDIASSIGDKNQKGEKIQKIIKETIDKIGDSVSYGQVCVDNIQYNRIDPRINMIVHGVDCGIILNGAINARKGFI